jgi:hypothetical protein
MVSVLDLIMGSISGQIKGLRAKYLHGVEIIWSDMFTCGLLFQRASTIKIQSCRLVSCKEGVIISMK